MQQVTLDTVKRPVKRRARNGEANVPLRDAKRNAQNGRRNGELETAMKGITLLLKTESTKRPSKRRAQNGSKRCHFVVQNGEHETAMEMYHFVAQNGELETAIKCITLLLKTESMKRPSKR
jgi:hypothetical protein